MERRRKRGAVIAIDLREEDSPEPLLGVGFPGIHIDPSLALTFIIGPFPASVV